MQGLSDRSGTESYKVHIDDGERVVSLGSLEEPVANLEEFDVRDVPLTTLDDALRDRDIGFMKIDVEGHERKMLAGAEALLRRARPSLLIEIAASNGQENFDAVCAFLRDLGYVMFFLHDGRTKSSNELTPELRRETTWTADGRRIPSLVFNFFFVHGEEAVDRVRAAIDARLAV